MSEYGFQGMPNLETFKEFASNEDLNLSSEAVKSHQKHGTGYETINEYMERDYVVPKRFEDYVYVSQLLQADGMKTAIEAHRRAKPNCMGTLFWQLNDCWPVTSWSSVDYFGRWKALHYQVKRSYENLLVSITEIEDNYVVFIVNDDLVPYKGTTSIVLLDFNGTKLWEVGLRSAVQPGSSKAHFVISKKDFEKFSLKNAVLSATFTTENKTVSANYYFVKPKELQLTKPELLYQKTDLTTVEVTSDVLAKNVFLTSPEGTTFSDNYFDILPHQKVVIKLSKPTEEIELKSLFDFMK